jgi:predicted enzyme related to lactoylglutathione lyase
MSTGWAAGEALETRDSPALATSRAVAAGVRDRVWSVEDWPRALRIKRMSIERLILVVLEVEGLKRAVHFCRDQLGIPLKLDVDHGGGDRWISGEHAAISYGENAFLHFALYKSKGVVTRNVQIGFAIENLEQVHQRLVAADVRVEHGPRDEPWGKTARYIDPDGNSVSLTETARKPN